MSGSDGIKKLCAVLHRHHELIADAYFSGHRQIPHTENNEKAIAALLQQKVAWHLDELEGVQLSSKLTALLDVAVRAERRLQIGDDVGRLWAELDGHLSDYKISRSNVDHDNTKFCLLECAHDLIEEVNQAILRYARYIDRNFSFAQSIELRLQQNERVLKRAAELIEILEGCDLTDYQKATGDDPVLRKLFCRYMPQSLEKAKKEFRRTVADLQAMLTSIREEQVLSELIHCFQAQYERDPGFTPSEPAFIDGIPVVFNIASHLMGKASPNIYIDSHIDSLADIAQSIQIAAPIDRKKADNEPVILDDSRNQEAEPTPSDELFDASQAAIEWVIDNNSCVKASVLYRELGIVEAYDIWIYAFLNSFFGLELTTREALSLTLDEIPDPVFTGNRTVVDLELAMAPHGL